MAHGPNSTHQGSRFFMFIKVYMKLAHTPSHTLAQSYSGYKTLVLESVVSQPFSNHGPFSDLISFLPGAHIHPILLSDCPPSVCAKPWAHHSILLPHIGNFHQVALGISQWDNMAPRNIALPKYFPSIILRSWTVKLPATLWQLNINYNCPSILFSMKMCCLDDKYLPASTRESNGIYNPEISYSVESKV